jgi:anthranilate phosphoribosyltransferase
MISEELRRLLDARPLTEREIGLTFEALTSPTADDVDRAAILLALSGRGYPPGEVVGFAREMRRRAVPFPIPARDHAIDLCGSGGATNPSFNVSTVSAFVVRAAGVKVAKHGNRSRRVCGSSDLLDALGLPVETSLPFARAAYRRHGITFLHAPLFHPATAAVGPVRRRLGIPTIFNRLGPLSNPAHLKCQVTGAVDAASVTETAQALRSLGVDCGIAMTSDDGCDEFSPRAPTTAVAWTSTRSRRIRIQPADLLPTDDRRGDWGPLPPPAAAEETERLLAGGGGARRGSILLTSGAALWVAGKAPTLPQGVESAREALDSGAAERVLDRLRALAASYPRNQER